MSPKKEPTKTVGEESKPPSSPLGANVKIASKSQEGVKAVEESLASRFTIAYASQLLPSDNGGYHRYLILVGGAASE